MEKKEKNIIRDEKGRICKGSVPNPTGNSYLKEVAAIRHRLFDMIKVEDWDGIREALIKKSAQGDVRAMGLLFSYVMGKPVQQIDMSMTQATITPAEAQERIKKFFGIGE